MHIIWLRWSEFFLLYFARIRGPRMIEQENERIHRQRHLETELHFCLDPPPPPSPLKVSCSKDEDVRRAINYVLRRQLFVEVSLSKKSAVPRIKMFKEVSCSIKSAVCSTTPSYHPNDSVERLIRRLLIMLLYFFL